MSTRKDISIIVAIASNMAIGKDNDLLWHISDDLKRFKKLTMDHTIIMGRRTFLSLPNGPLKNRRHIVISDIEEEKFAGCFMARSIEEAVDLCENNEENFVIGGGMIYSQFLNFANRLYLTKVHKDFDADVFFPEINYKEWILVSKEDIINDDQNNFSYSYELHKRSENKII